MFPLFYFFLLPANFCPSENEYPNQHPTFYLHVFG